MSSYINNDLDHGVIYLEFQGSKIPFENESWTAEYAKDWWDYYSPYLVRHSLFASSVLTINRIYLYDDGRWFMEVASNNMKWMDPLTDIYYDITHKWRTSIEYFLTLSEYEGHPLDEAWLPLEVWQGRSTAFNDGNIPSITSDRYKLCREFPSEALLDKVEAITGLRPTQQIPKNLLVQIFYEGLRRVQYSG